MSIQLQIFLIVASVLVSLYAFRKIRKAQLNIDDAIYWVVSAVLLVVMSIFPGIPTYIATLLGIESPVNFVFLFMIFLVIVKLFMISIDLSVQKYRLNLLVEKLALIKKYESRSEEKSNTEN